MANICRSGALSFLPLEILRVLWASADARRSKPVSWREAGLPVSRWASFPNCSPTADSSTLPVFVATSLLSLCFLLRKQWSPTFLDLMYMINITTFRFMPSAPMLDLNAPSALHWNKITRVSYVRQSLITSLVGLWSLTEGRVWHNAGKCWCLMENLSGQQCRDYYHENSFLTSDTRKDEWRTCPHQGKPESFGQELTLLL